VSIADSGMLLLNCYTGCTYDEIRAALGSPDLSGDGWTWPSEYSLSAVTTDAVVTDINTIKFAKSLNVWSGALAEPANAAVLAQTMERFGLTADQVVTLRLGFRTAGPSDWVCVGSKFANADRLIVPLYDLEKGTPAACQGRATDPSTPKSERWMSLTGQGWVAAGKYVHPEGAQHPALIVCEGLSDGVSAYGAGFDSIAVRGASLARKSVPAIAALAAGQTVAIVGDNDEAGAKFATALRDGLRARGVDARIVSLLQGDDLNDWLQLSGPTFPDELNAAIESAAPQPLAEDGPIQTMATRRPDGLPNPDTFFIGTRMDLEKLHDEVIKMGPLATGPGDNLYSYKDGLWTVGAEKEVARRVTSLLGARKLETHVHNLIGTLKVQRPFIGTDQPAKYLNCKNGLLDWVTGELVPHSPNVPSTYQLQVDWAPDATCTAFDKWLDDIAMKDPELIEVIWQVIAAAIMPQCPVHRAVMIHGSGRNGKSTLIRIIEQLIGKQYVSNVTLQDLSDSRFATAELFGKQVNMQADLGSNFVAHTSTFKMATGGDSLQAEHKYGQPFQFVNRALMIFACNELPGTSDTTHGFWERWLILPFDFNFLGKEDPTIEDGLIEELAGILPATVRALQRLGNANWKFTDSKRIKEATLAYRTEADAVRLFADQELEVGVGLKLERTEAYMEFKYFCEDQGRKPVAANKFYSRIGDLDGITDTNSRSGNKRYILGAAKLTDTPTNAEGATAAQPPTEPPAGVAKPAETGKTLRDMREERQANKTPPDVWAEFQATVSAPDLQE
jgi:putative DNA primase/helicase